MIQTKSIVMIIAAVLMAGFAQAAALSLPQGTATGRILSGDGQGRVVLGGPCSITIHGNRVVSTSLIAGELDMTVNSLQENPSTFVGVTGEVAIAIDLSKDGTISEFAKMPLIGGQPTPTGDAQTVFCQVAPLR